MKVAIRRSVFETNSSSTHTLTLVPKKDYEADKTQEKPKYSKYRVVAGKYDKLLMACGCCYEIYDNGKAYNFAISLLVGEYCDKTNENYDKIYTDVIRINDSGRACHMKFFSEGALYDSEYDYWLFYTMFNGELDQVKEKIRNYFDNKNVLCYREYFGGVRWDDDED